MKHSNIEGLDTLTPLPESITVCATVDESGDEHVITDLMIRRACEEIESEQLWAVAGAYASTRAQRAPVGTATILAFEARA